MLELSLVIKIHHYTNTQCLHCNGQIDHMETCRVIFLIFISWSKPCGSEMVKVNLAAT